MSFELYKKHASGNANNNIFYFAFITYVKGKRYKQTKPGKLLSENRIAWINNTSDIFSSAQQPGSFGLMTPSQHTLVLFL